MEARERMGRAPARLVSHWRQHKGESSIINSLTESGLAANGPAATVHASA